MVEDLHHIMQGMGTYLVIKALRCNGTFMQVGPRPCTPELAKVELKTGGLSCSSAHSDSVSDTLKQKDKPTSRM